MKYMELQVITTTEASDAVAEMMYGQGAAGVLIEDPNDFEALNSNNKDWDYVDEELIKLLGEDCKVKGYFVLEEFGEARLKYMASHLERLEEFGLDKGKCIVTTREIDDEDWANAWKKHYKPAKIGDKIVIKPTWEEYEAKAGEVIVEIDPGMAFGTGVHETTIMCVKLLEKYIMPGNTVFDIGCGSGILGIAAAKLDAGRVVCVDIDKAACNISKDNAERNKVSDVLEVTCGNLLSSVFGNADVIVSNIVADIIISFAGEAKSVLNKGGVFISSGIIKDRKDDVLKKLNSEGFKALEVLDLGEWCAIAAERE